MALTSKITTTINHPTELGVTFAIRKLSHHQLMMAEDARFEAVATKARALGDIKLPEGDAVKAAAEAAKPENKWHRLTVLKYGVTAWSYTTEPPSEELLADLDEETAAFLFGEIIAFSLRSADEGKASAGASPPATDQGADAGLPS